MLCLETTSNLSVEAIHTLLRHRVQGPVHIRRLISLYLIKCSSTPEYQQLLTSIQQHGGFPLLVEGHVFLLHSKL